MPVVTQEQSYLWKFAYSAIQAGQSLFAGMGGRNGMPLLLLVVVLVVLPLLLLLLLLLSEATRDLTLSTSSAAP
jgi:uncharacterized membrane protein